MTPVVQQNTCTVNKSVQQQQAFPNVRQTAQAINPFSGRPLSKENPTQAVSSISQQKPVTTVKPVIRPTTAPVQQNRFKPRRFN